MYPDSTNVITAHVVDAGSDLYTCINAGHVLRATEVNIPEMVVINGFNLANEQMQFTVRILSDSQLELFPYETLLVRTVLCFIQSTSESRTIDRSVIRISLEDFDRSVRSDFGRYL